MDTAHHLVDRILVRAPPLAPPMRTGVNAAPLGRPQFYIDIIGFVLNLALPFSNLTAFQKA